jgi:hypothetical protein
MPRKTIAVIPDCFMFSVTSHSPMRGLQSVFGVYQFALGILQLATLRELDLKQDQSTNIEKRRWDHPLETSHQAKEMNREEYKSTRKKWNFV